VEVRGALGGAPATARLLDDALLVEHALGVTVVELLALDGVDHDAQTVALYPHGEAPVMLGLADAPALARAVTDAAAGVPELMASLRAIGSPRARPGSDHDAWFGALLAARRAAHDARGLEARLAAFDAPALAAGVEGVIGAFAEARAPGQPRDARALAEELRELSAPLPRALAELARHAHEVREAPPELRLARWREWVAALRAVYAAADASWEAMLPALAAPRGAQGSFWRRVLRRGGAA
jgi:hypothetical protein